MKLILNEEQYNRIFNNKKRKLVITESQYKSLLLESAGLNSIHEGDSIRLVSGDNSLDFKIAFKEGDKMLMMNCNNGVYKNSYCLVDGSSLNGNVLSSKLAKKDDVDEKDPMDSIKSKPDAWRNNSFKGITEFSVYKDGGEGISCKLPDIENRNKLFSINLSDGSIIPTSDQVKGDYDKSDDKSDKKEVNHLNVAMGTLNKFKEGNKYKLTLGEDKGGKNVEDGYINIGIISRAGKFVAFQVLEVSGESGNIYKHFQDKDMSFVIDKSNVSVDEESKANFKMLNLDVEMFGDETDDDGNKVKEEDTIVNIMMIDSGSKYELDDDGNEVSKDDKEGDKEDEDTSVAELSDEEMKKLIKRLVTDNQFLQDAISTKPNHFLELIGVSRKKGLLPIEGRMKKWYSSVKAEAEGSLISKRFPVNKAFTVRLDKSSFNVVDEGLASRIDFNSDFKVKSIKPRANDNKGRFATNFSQKIEQEEEYEYIMYLGKEVEDNEEFYIYTVQLYHKPQPNKAGDEIGTGKLKILKDVKK